MPGLSYVSTPPCSPFIYEPPVSLGTAFVRAGARILKHSYINGGRIHSGVYIGRYCSMGYDVVIGTGHHDLNLLSTSSWFDSLVGSTVKFAEPDVLVRIKNDVWVGDGVTILNGVTIGNGVAIGAGAVVTGDLPDYCIAVGVPAKVLRYRFDQNTIERLLQLKWWELDDKLLKEHKLLNVQASLDYLESLPAECRTAVHENLVRV